SEEATATCPPDLAFDLAAVTQLPFGLTSVDDPDLLYFLQYYATEGRRRMSNWLARAGRYDEAVGAAIAAEGGPRELLWVAAVESNFEATARSRAGAVGMFQFMPQTGRSRGLRIDSVVDERRDPVLAARAAAHYLHDLDAALGSWPLALAAYNAGHGHVRSGIRDASATDFWELDDYGEIYGSARRYALRVMTIAIIDANRAAFDFDSVVPDDPWRFDVVDVAPNVRLSVLGQAVDLTATELQALNPSLVALRTPSDVESYPLRIPAGSTAAFVDSYDRLRARYGDTHRTATLRFGETVDDLAARFGVPARVIRAVNGLDPGVLVPYGSELVVPGDTPPRAEQPAGGRTVVVPRTRFAFADRVRLFYETNVGDTIADISRNFNVDPDHVCAWNDLDPDANLLDGMTLQLFVAPDFDTSTSVVLDESTVTAVPLGSEAWVAMQAAAQESAPQRRTYRVRRGDTPSAIATRFGIRVSDLARWNDLGDDLTIFAGELLVVGR
ncbi:MAG: transglycosylase SLT domain-containing protein, partial [Myxococcales bacterium]|nr:transglycosylase SLT domain-containing protein [Myxococcales bacterium]